MEESWLRRGEIQPRVGRRTPRPDSAMPRNRNTRRRRLSVVSGSDGAALAETPASRLPKVRPLAADRMTMAAEVALASASLEEAGAVDPFVDLYDHPPPERYVV